MGDVTMRDVLETHKLLPAYAYPVSLAICLAEERLAEFAETLAKELRDKEIVCTIDYSGRKLKDQIRSAVKQGAPFLLCLGENEVQTEKFRIKNLRQRTETALERAQIADFIRVNMGD
jgi:histidyl-tRNA synthetase